MTGSEEERGAEPEAAEQYSGVRKGGFQPPHHPQPHTATPMDSHPHASQQPSPPLSPHAIHPPPCNKHSVDLVSECGTRYMLSPALSGSRGRGKQGAEEGTSRGGDSAPAGCSKENGEGRQSKDGRSGSAWGGSHSCASNSHHLVPTTPFAYPHKTIRPQDDALTVCGGVNNSPGQNRGGCRSISKEAEAEGDGAAVKAGGANVHVGDGGATGCAEGVGVGVYEGVDVGDCGRWHSGLPRVARRHTHGGDNGSSSHKGNLRQDQVPKQASSWSHDRGVNHGAGAAGGERREGAITLAGRLARRAKVRSSWGVPCHFQGVLSFVCLCIWGKQPLTLSDITAAALAPITRCIASPFKANLIICLCSFPLELTHSPRQPTPCVFHEIIISPAQALATAAWLAVPGCLNVCGGCASTYLTLPSGAAAPCAPRLLWLSLCVACRQQDTW